MSALTLKGQENLAKIGRIRRAREFHLYNAEGIRYLDFYQADGRAILGHRPGKLTQTVKNILEKGLYAEYPSIEQDRLTKTLLRLFPGFGTVYLFRNYERAASALSGRSFRLWRPWQPVTESSAEILILQVPVPGGFDCAPVLSKQPLPGFIGDCLSPAAAAGILSLTGLWSCDREKNDQAFWGQLPSPERIWRREGPYLYFLGDDSAWQLLFDRFLENRILLPPQRDIPAIIPLEITVHEVLKLAGSLGEAVQ